MEVRAEAASDPIRSMLRQGERIVWRGQPEVAAFALRGAWYLIPFSLLWGGFAIFWEAMVLTNGAPLFFALWGVPFVAIGLYLIFGRLLVARLEAQRTHYAITDERVLIRQGMWRHRTLEMPLDNLPPAQLEEYGRGVGSIMFGAAGWPRVPPGWPTLGMYGSPPAFASIADAERVYRLLQDASVAARRS